MSQDLDIIIRRDGRVCVQTPAWPLLLGYVKRLDTHDGLAWFFTRDPKLADWQVGGIQRHQAVKALVAELVSQGRGRRS